MEELELKHINQNSLFITEKGIERMIGAYQQPNDKIFIGFNKNKDTRIWHDLSDLKIIKRPLSDISKEISIEGINFVPIEELYNLAFGGFSEVIIKNKNGIVSCENCIEKLTFWIDHIDFKTIGIAPDGENEWSQPIKLLNLFEKLNEWDFDIYDLLSKGLAIDINTIQNEQSQI